MAETHVLSALVSKYREVSGRLVQCEKEAKDLKQQLRTLNATIRMYRADFKTSGILPKRIYKQNPYFPKGKFSRVVMDILREADGPLSARELAIMALRRQGIEPDRAMADQFRRTLNGALVRYEKEGKITVDKGTFPKRWEVVG